MPRSQFIICITYMGSHQEDGDRREDDEPILGLGGEVLEFGDHGEQLVPPDDDIEDVWRM